uniref:Tyrosine-protein kinase ephrin type A/B receptor-like domain-containing protein n=1 Tax=Chromera velia CCMP2878 TaxID=1169474 RepID=A0A0G4HKZ7_9ALVE|eukprot:Cvel_28627.t1-p1 / transcript=Cvel_28627.t1 / gene=Cvel_28627 / organism=Chromera_velia_CCMP2878 / gene_product=Multiple epidermal growth factor-like domains, putative / transcript_product=Multiple epidermal growth factor-like domains, putative / location=Cvel_scaffold3781:4223-9924(-) / protein_length=1222 / sequence_SO=supercontig / SO=protein_coding / is_pseudo=false
MRLISDNTTMASVLSSSFTVNTDSAPAGGSATAGTPVADPQEGPSGTLPFLSVQQPDLEGIITFSYNAVSVTPGSTVKYTITLSKLPTASLKIGVGGSGGFQITSPDSGVLEFLPTDSGLSQTVTVAASEGVASSEKTITQVMDFDSGKTTTGFRMVPASGTVKVGVLSDAQAHVFLYRENQRIIEGDSSAFKVSLSDAPATGTDVQISWSCNPDNLSFSTSQPLTLDSTNWDTYNSIFFSVPSSTSPTSPTGISYEVTCTFTFTSADTAYSGGALMIPNNYSSVAVVRSQCGLGTYGTDCAQCAIDKSCANGTALDCATGEYLVPQIHLCVSCPQGHDCTNFVYGIPVPCPPGSYSAAGSAGCTACVAGQACPLPVWTANAPVTCPAGTYSRAEAAECTVCPAGHFCPTTSAAPTACSAGEYSVEGQQLCSACPAGSFCPTTFDFPITCPPGTHSAENATACTSCGGGNKCPQLNTAATTYSCNAGSYVPEGTVAGCLLCPPGFECAIGKLTTKPVACSPGYYALGGATACTQCPAGYNCPNAYRGPEPCGPGTYSSAGAVKCTKCNAAYPCAGSANNLNVGDGVLCPGGFYCSGTGDAYPCPPGTSSGPDGGSTVNDCGLCSAGKYCPGGTKTSDELSCSTGHYCPAGSRFPHEHACPAGSFNTAADSTASSACTTCPAESFCPVGSRSSGQTCPYGHYCLAGARVPVPAAAGSYSGKTQGKSTNSFTTCDVGRYCPEGSQYAQRCPAGTYRTTTGGTRAEDCTDCPAGQSSPRLGHENTALPLLTCDAGYFCPARTISPQTHPCLRGTYTDSTGLSTSGGCSSCPAGKWCEEAVGGTFPPQDCPPGYYCPLGTASPVENPCPAGTYSNSYNLTASSECTQCPAGSFCLAGSTAPSGSCAPGYYCPAGSSTAYNTQCLAGKYYSSCGASDSGNCTACVAGSYCPIGSSSPLSCPPGKYSAASASTCTDCTAGSKCTGGTVTPTNCGVGFYSAAGASECLACPVGNYCDSATTTSTNLASKVCANGFVCNEGMDHVPASTADDCPKGHYCQGVGGSGGVQITSPDSGVLEFLPTDSGLSQTVTVAASEGVASSEKTITHVMDFDSGKTTTGFRMVPASGVLTVKMGVLSDAQAHVFLYTENQRIIEGDSSAFKDFLSDAPVTGTDVQISWCCNPDRSSSSDSSSGGDSDFLRPVGVSTLLRGAPPLMQPGPLLLLCSERLP